MFLHIIWNMYHLGVNVMLFAEIIVSSFKLSVFCAGVCLVSHSRVSLTVLKESMFLWRGTRSRTRSVPSRPRTWRSRPWRCSSRTWSQEPNTRPGRARSSAPRTRPHERIVVRAKHHGSKAVESWRVQRMSHEFSCLKETGCFMRRKVYMQVHKYTNSISHVSVALCQFTVLFEQIQVCCQCFSAFVHLRKVCFWLNELPVGGDRERLWNDGWTSSSWTVNESIQRYTCYTCGWFWLLYLFLFIYAVICDNSVLNWW